MNIKRYMSKTGQKAKEAANIISHLTTAKKNAVLYKLAENLLNHRDALQKANQKDLDIAKNNNLSPELLDRLTLTDNNIDAMAEGLKQIAGLADPIGMITNMALRPSGIQVGKMRVPLGVVGVIYESRPNVTADVAGLCLKSGNATILRGGSEAFHSNQIIAKYISKSLKTIGLPKETIQIISTPDRAAVGELLKMQKYVDVIIPRGGKGLIKRVSSEARMPVIKHLDGICHIYIDKDADLQKAIKIAFNAKTQRYGTCNTMECLLVSRNIAKKVLIKLYKLYKDAKVEIRGCAESAKIINGIKIATKKDYATEYLAPILSLKIVADIGEAIEHISKYGSKHTDAIVTENFTTARRFLREIDSSSVMINASTRFADGFEYGLGAEVGISTDKFHARGPVGLEGLTSEKYIVLGDGHIRS